MKKLVVLVLGGVLAVSACSDPGAAQHSGDFPKNSRLTFMSAFGASGSSYEWARTLAPCVGDRIGARGNGLAREGGSGAVGMNALVSADPDGLTYMVNGSSAVFLPETADGVGYTFDDLAVVAIVNEFENVVFVKADGPYDTFDDLVEAAKRSPGKVTVATPGPTTVISYELRRFKDLYDVEFGLVPLPGPGEGVAAVAGGNIDAVMTPCRPRRNKLMPAC